VRGNRIRNAAFSAVRGNTASNLQIVGNTCTGLGEVALYAEFGFEGALIANNIVDGAALGVSVTNFNQGGRLAVVQGNVIRNLTNKRPPGTDPNDLAGVGSGIEADTVVTGNVVENAPNIGIAAGWGAYLRDVAVNANVIRNADFGITVSVAPGAGAAVIADNLISGVRRGAIVGMEWSNRSPAISPGRRHPLRAIVDRRQPGTLSGDRLGDGDDGLPIGGCPLDVDSAGQPSGLGERLGHPQRAELGAVPVAHCRLREQRERVPLGVGEREQARDQRRRDGLRRPPGAVIAFDGNAQTERR
jgi:putative cofactor-binding repeat protein